MDSADNGLLDLYFEALATCFMLARGDQLHLLRKGYRTKAYDERGLHPFSTAYGGAQAILGLIDLEPDVRELIDVPPLDIKTIAARDAYEQFTEEIRTGQTHDHDWRM